MPINVLIVPGSLRKGSFSHMVAVSLQKELIKQKAEAIILNLLDFPLPIFDYDLEKKQGVPEKAKEIAYLFLKYDAIIFVTPEYNASIPPLLKNMIDWISRVDREKVGFSAFQEKVAAVCACSPGYLGGVRAGDHLRNILFQLKMEIINSTLAIPFVTDAFDIEGNFKSKILENSASQMCSILIEDAILRSKKINIH